MNRKFTIYILILISITAKSQEIPKSYFTIDFVGFKTGYAFNIDREANRTPLINPYIMDMEFISKYRIGFGLHGLSTYYFNSGATIGKTVFPYLILNVIKSQTSDITEISKRGYTQAVGFKQLNILVGANSWSGVSQILVDNNEFNISGTVAWIGLKYRNQFKRMLAYNIQLAYLYYQEPLIKDINRSFIELQVGLIFGNTIFKPSGSLANAQSVNKLAWHNKFEWMGFGSYVHFKPEKLNDFFESYGALPIEGGFTGGGMVTYKVAPNCKLGFFMNGPAGKLRGYQTIGGSEIGRHYGYYDYSLLGLYEKRITSFINGNAGLSGGLFILDEIGILDKTNDLRLVKYASGIGMSGKVLLGFDFYFINKDEFKIGLAILGAINYMYIGRGNVYNDKHEKITDFPEINFNGYQISNGVKIRF